LALPCIHFWKRTFFFAVGIKDKITRFSAINQNPIGKDISRRNAVVRAFIAKFFLASQMASR
jgi:hypothetical protein